MRYMLIHSIEWQLLLLSLVATVFSQQQSTARILLYTATADFRHDSIPTAIQALHNQSSTFNIQFDATEDKAQFTVQTLSKYDAIMFVSTTGEGIYYILVTLIANIDSWLMYMYIVLDDTGKAAFQDYLNKVCTYLLHTNII